MGPHRSTHFLIGALICAALAAPAVADAQVSAGLYRAETTASISDRSVRGMTAATRKAGWQGEQDGRRNRPFGFDNNPAFRDGDRGFNARLGSRLAYRDEFRRGFADGYRSGYDAMRGSSFRQFGGNGPRFGANRRVPGSYQEPAFARGYADGYEEGLKDFRGRDRYDPVGTRDYRNGDQGYYSSYGSRDAYKNNYRAGFRQGYEEGYRSGR